MIKVVFLLQRSKKKLTTTLAAAAAAFDLFLLLTCRRNLLTGRQNGFFPSLLFFHAENSSRRAVFASVFLPLKHGTMKLKQLQQLALSQFPSPYCSGSIASLPQNSTSPATFLTPDLITIWTVLSKGFLRCGCIFNDRRKCVLYIVVCHLWRRISCGRRCRRLCRRARRPLPPPLPASATAAAALSLLLLLSSSSSSSSTTPATPRDSLRRR